ncbi:MAG: hypothetical protein RSD75_04485, partial [Mucinivorans sp.]
MNNNIIKNNTASKMRISVVELPEINCSRRLSFEFERLDSPNLQHFKGGNACRTEQIGVVQSLKALLALQRVITSGE